MNPCTCGHAPEEHGGDPKYPGSTACSVDDCECIAYEDDGPIEGSNDEGSSKG
jgi:hypothetical protein